MATVRMKKGDKFADVFDSPETIKQAQLDGYSLVEEKKKETKTAEDIEPTVDVSKVEESEKAPKSKRQ